MTLFFCITAALLAAQGNLLLGLLFFAVFVLLWSCEMGTTDQRQPRGCSGYPDVMPPDYDFGSAFAIARSRGLRRFKWRGGWYHTRTAEEEEEAALKPGP